MATPPPLPPQAQQQFSPPPIRKRGSLMWLWITLAIIGVLIFVGIIAALWFFNRWIQLETEGSHAEKPMLEERAEHQTVWVENDEYETYGPAPEPPEDVFELTSYKSPAGELAAYVTPDPGDGKKHPAMVWAKGGFGGIGEFLWEEPSRTNDQSARAFREAGIVLMCPSWRGENDNPGQFELFYGEIEDFLAAIEHVKTLPYVDPDRVYIGGHSTGGTVVLLAAGAGSDTDFRAAFSFGGAADMESIMDDGEGYGNTPYSMESVRDHQLRSAIRFTPFIKKPTFYFEGENEYNTWDADRMATGAERLEVPFEAFEITDGDHFDILAPLTKLVAQKILKDDGETCDIAFTQSELDDAWKAVNGVSLSSELIRWKKEGAKPEALGAILEYLEDDAMPENAADIAQLKMTLDLLYGDGSDEAVVQISDLLDLGYGIWDDEIVAKFEVEILPGAHDYLRKIAAAENPTDEALNYALWMVVTLTTVGTEESGELILDLIRKGFGGSQVFVWDDVFSSLDPDFPVHDVVVPALRKNPPSGEIGEVLADWSNDRFFEDGEEAQIHFYDSEAGLKILTDWLKAPAKGNEDEMQSKAFTAGLSLAFLENVDRKTALKMGYEYPDFAVQLETAWADLKQNKNSKAGLEFIQKACLDLDWSERAKSYLGELDRESDIPGEAQKPEFAAKAEMIKWLQHPNEIGQSPETIETFDTREIYWPPLDEKTTLFLFKFTYRFEGDEAPSTSYGLHGGAMTWSSFQEFETPPSPEQLYVHHCALELSRMPGLDETEPLPVSAEDALKILREKNPGQFEGDIPLDKSE